MFARKFQKRLGNGKKLMLEITGKPIFIYFFATVTASNIGGDFDDSIRFKN